MKNFCLYHKSCADGFGSAFAVWKRYGDEFQYIGVNYQEPLPQEISDLIAENYSSKIDFELEPVKCIDKLFIVDFSYNKDTLEQLEKITDHIFVIDHHVSAQENLKEWTPLNGVKIFDMNHSGAILTWKYLFPDKNVPLFLQYIEDRDLWKWQLPNSREFSAGLNNEEMNFKIWDYFLNMGQDTIEVMIRHGKTILQYQNKLVKSLAEKVEIIVNDDGHKVGVINSCLFQSELGDFICNNFDVHYTDCYFMKGHEIIHSLRSRGDFDVSVIAKIHGGGGHFSSAGYKEQL